MKKNMKIKWLAEPKESNYPAAQSYLTLIYDESRVEKIIQLLLKAEVTSFKAKDIFRASSLSLLGVSNDRVERDRRKIKDAEALSPILLVRDSVNGKVIIADGYHRLCAVYSFDEDLEIPCKIVTL
jgi:hypothetical protein